MNEVYANFPIRDQDSEVRMVSDLLQSWGGPAREPLRVRLRRGMERIAARLSLGRRIRRFRQAGSPCGG